MSEEHPTDAELTHALGEMPIPEPQPQARQRAILQALAVFDASRENIFQGSAQGRRPIPIVARIFNFMGDWHMNMKRLPALALITTTAILTLTLWPQYQKWQLGTTQPFEEATLQSSDYKGADHPPITAQVVRPEEKEKKTASDPRDLAAAKPEPAPRLVEEDVGEMLAAPPPRQEGLTIGGSTTAVQPSVMSPYTSTPPRVMPSAPAHTKGKMAMEKSQFATMARQDQTMPPQSVVQGEERDRFSHQKLNPVHQTGTDPVSTFSVDVDTASYAFVRARINAGRLPPADAVRVEEMINYFDYDYALPKERDIPFATTVKVYPTPWNKDTRLLHIGIQGFDLPQVSKPRSNLVFLVDVSGSMSEANKLPLLKKSLALLVDKLQPEDTVAMVVYAGAAGVVLEPTPVKDRHKIMAALEKLSAGGSTAGGEGIKLAYTLAESGFDPKIVNRVILATDGDFNVGVTDSNALKDMVVRYRKSGVFLSVLGFGQGNYNDVLMQELAQNGNGVAAYIDTLNEAQKVLVDEAAANLFPIAKDVKIQVEFNPARVAEYRLIGYETRHLNREDFVNDKVDAGEIGSGHRVTALYEVALTGGSGQLMEPLRYGGATPTVTDQKAGQDKELAFVKIRYKLPDQDKSLLITRPVGEGDVISTAQEIPKEMGFAAAVAAFGQRLTGGQHLKEFGYDDILKLAQESKGDDPFGYRGEFLGLVRLAKSLDRK